MTDCWGALIMVWPISFIFWKKEHSTKLYTSSQKPSPYSTNEGTAANSKSKDTI